VRGLVTASVSQPALVEAHVAGRRAISRRDRVAAPCTPHVEADQLGGRASSRLATRLGLADPGGTREQEATDRLLGHLQARARELDRGRQRVHRRILPEDRLLQVGVQACAAIPCPRAETLPRRNARDLRDNVLGPPSRR